MSHSVLHDLDGEVFQVTLTQVSGPYKAIVSRLHYVFGLKRSVSWLKIQFRRLGLRRRRNTIRIRDIRALLRVELASSNELLGYRSMWKLLREKYRIPVTRNSIMLLMQVEDPQGVKRRKHRRLKRRVYRNKGPNYIWRMDAYEKLNPFGITISGCIDGYSRNIIWLKVAPSNKQPGVLLRYYLECVEKLCGCPTILRCDLGTENSMLATAQTSFRMYHDDTLAAEKSVIYGASTHNTRIEGWWSQLCKSKTSWWIDCFKGLAADGLFDSRSVLHRKCLAFVSVPLLNKDLVEFVSQWNTHPIRHNPLADFPAGIPVDIYEMPDEFGTQDYVKPIDENLWVHLMINDSKKPPKFYNHHFEEIANVYLLEQYSITVNEVSHSNLKHFYVSLDTWKALSFNVTMY